DECIVRLNRGRNRNVIGLAEANGLQKLPTNVLHRISSGEVYGWLVVVCEAMEDFGHSEFRSDDGLGIALVFCQLGREVETAPDAFACPVKFGLQALVCCGLQLSDAFPDLSTP